jgi:hypothetical protein
MKQGGRQTTTQQQQQTPPQETRQLQQRQHQRAVAVVPRDRWWSPKSQVRKNFFSDVLKSRCWKVLLIVLTFILLFGAQIRTLWIPAAGDTAVDVVFTVTFALFWIDLLMRVDAEPGYFNFRFNCFRGNIYEHGGGKPGCSLGSFLFWCDLGSTLALLHELSYVDQKNFAVIDYDITLDTFGIPVRTYFALMPL